MGPNPTGLGPYKEIRAGTQTARQSYEDVVRRRPFYKPRRRIKLANHLDLELRPPEL